MKHGLVANGYPEERMSVIPNPVYARAACIEQVSELREHLAIEKHEQVIGIAGRISRWKGHVELLLEAFVVMQEIPELKVLIVGGLPKAILPIKNKLLKW